MNPRFMSTKNAPGFSGQFQKQNYKGQKFCFSQSRPGYAKNSSRVTRFYSPNFTTSDSSDRGHQLGCHTARAFRASPQTFNPGNDVMRRVLYIVRGAPGSGKSTLSRQLCANGRNGVILSTDDFFITPQGFYSFDCTLLPEAHDWNKERAKENMTQGKSPIVIDNTNIESWEMKPYMLMAVNFCYEIEIVEPNTSWKFDANVLFKRNSHNVPMLSIERMLSRYEKNVTVESVLGRHAYQRYKEQCLDFSRSYRPDVKAQPSGRARAGTSTRGGGRGRAGISTRGGGRGNTAKRGGKVANYRRPTCGAGSTRGRQNASYAGSKYRSQRAPGEVPDDVIQSFDRMSMK